MHKNSLTGQNHKDFTLNWFVCISALYLFLLFTGTSTLNAQNAKLSLHKENATFEEVFKEIEAKTGYKFVYSTSISTKRKVSIQETDQSLNEVLRNLFRSKRNISFRISNKHIALFLAQTKKDFRDGRRYAKGTGHRGQRPHKRDSDRHDHRHQRPIQPGGCRR